ncbi:PREDICTED: uncharacterized protein LOC105364835 [Ceratosolen solmsi marchali]|uniref:Uncharacterized protein LOC105364835 n=1 Tax=Ceratosolen solmsi marchali TaxID=326594 RepID=A0AAJ7DYJ9_9HYME|nr:PREDICTED: uncharacterized protein LOC105364835 [Ceratosolen solmsi marchali]
MKKSIEAIVEEVIINPQKIQPILVNFQNGKLKEEESKKIKIGLFNDKTNKIILALSNGQTIYRGFRPDFTNDLTYTMLAIRNKKTGKIKLIQAERWNVAPVLNKYINTTTDNETNQVVALNKQFGSKKVKRRTEQYEKMKINVENVKDQLEKTVSHIEIQRDELEFTIKDDLEDNLILPPINKNANQLCEIYNINDIVPDNILKTLYSKINEALNEIEDKAEFFSKTVKYCKDDQQYTMKMALLLYIEGVILWLNNPIKFGKKSDIVVCPYSPEVNNYIIDTYSIASNNGRQRPGRMKDKGIIHCIILGLIIWNFKLDLELFSSMFKIRIGIKKLFELAKWTHAVQHKDDKKCVIYKLPLPSHSIKSKKK